MDYLHAGWPPHLIREEFNLSEQQMNEVMDYIGVHRDEVDREYQDVLREADESRQYWETRNRDRLVKVAVAPSKPEQEQIRAKLQAAKTRLGMT
jgi:hypothetical protein